MTAYGVTESKCRGERWCEVGYDDLVKLDNCLVSGLWEASTLSLS